MHRYTFTYNGGHALTLYRPAADNAYMERLTLTPAQSDHLWTDCLCEIQEDDAAVDDVLSGYCFDEAWERVPDEERPLVGKRIAAYKAGYEISYDGSSPPLGGWSATNWSTGDMLVSFPTEEEALDYAIRGPERDAESRTGHNPDGSLYYTTAAILEREQH